MNTIRKFYLAPSSVAAMMEKGVTSCTVPPPGAHPLNLPGLVHGVTLFPKVMGWMLLRPMPVEKSSTSAIGERLSDQVSHIKICRVSACPIAYPTVGRNPDIY